MLYLKSTEQWRTCCGLGALAHCSSVYMQSCFPPTPAFPGEGLCSPSTSYCTLSPYFFSLSLPNNHCFLSLFWRPECGCMEGPGETSTCNSASGQTGQWLSLPWAGSTSLHSVVTMQRHPSELLSHSVLRMSSSIEVFIFGHLQSTVNWGGRSQQGEIYFSASHWDTVLSSDGWGESPSTGGLYIHQIRGHLGASIPSEYPSPKGLTLNSK